MDHRSSSERLAEAMKRARRQGPVRGIQPTTIGLPSVPVASALTIAITREAGANGSLVAAAVGERLGWPVYDRELVEYVAKDMGVRSSLLDSLDEKHRGWLLECVETFTSVPTISDKAYGRHLLETLLSLSAHGECVIVGRGAAQALPATATLRVRLVGPVDERIKTVCRKFAMSPEVAKKWVERTDRQRVQFVKEHFQKDSLDPRGYDLVLNSARFTTIECAELIIEALHRLQNRAEAERPRASAIVPAST